MQQACKLAFVALGVCLLAPCLSIRPSALAQSVEPDIEARDPSLIERLVSKEAVLVEGIEEPTVAASPLRDESRSSAPPQQSAVRSIAPSPFTLGAYVEAFYQWNFNDPSNGITNFRAFDNRHNSFTLANVAVDTQWDYESFVGRLTLQIGHTPSTYYLSEPDLPGSSGANASNAELWKYLQQAYAGFRFGVGSGLTVAAGLFLSPIGPESMTVRDSFCWSRSNLFFGLPFYHTGVRTSYALSASWLATLAGYNGWNSVVDNNREKSIAAQLTFTRPAVVLSALYFGGVERPPHASEGRHFRHMLDAHVTWHTWSWLTVVGHLNGGLEPTDFGISHWTAGALHARLRIVDSLFFAVRGDAFHERAARSSSGRAAALFWPARWVSSATATLDYRPLARASLRLEYRHDHAADDMYFGGSVVGDGRALAYAANRRTQDTLTAGVTTWF